MTRVLSGLLMLAVLVAAAAVWKYGQLHTLAENACSATSHAAKLDLSSFVPLCKAVR